MTHPILRTIPGTGEAALFDLEGQIDQLDRNLNVGTEKASTARPVKSTQPRRKAASYPPDGKNHPWK